ncbi:MAG: SulP family inorganic anion transporter [Planctomycetota bacterium]
MNVAPPVVKPAHSGRFSVLTADLSAGITTGILSLPQGMAFAIIANVPPQYGLYAMIVPTIIAAFVRNSPFLTTGATNTSALVIGVLLATLLSARNDPIGVMLLITLLIGIIQILSGALRLGGLGRYVSKAVLIGFTFGAAMLIIISQLKNVLGLSGAQKSLLIDEIRNLAGSLQTFDSRALTIAMLSLIVVIICARISRLLPGALLAIVASAVYVSALGWNTGEHTVAMLGDIPRELPHLTVPNLSVFTDVLGPSLALAILGMVEVISIGKAVSAKGHIKFYPNRELLAQGAGNVVGSFFGCMPSSASWTRSVVNLQMGAKTRWVSVIAGLIVLLFLIALAPWAQCVPKACLGAIIIWIAVQMFDFAGARNVWRWSRKDAAVMLITFGALLFLEIQYAIYLGVFASLLLMLHGASRLHIVEMVETDANKFREVEINENTGSSPLLLLQLEGNLFFGVVDELKDRFEKIAANGVQVIIIRLKRAHGLDATTIEAITDFAINFKASGGRMILCGLKPDMFAQFSNAHLADVLGPENLLPTEAHTFDSVWKAIEIGKQHLDKQL